MHPHPLFPFNHTIPSWHKTLFCAVCSVPPENRMSDVIGKSCADTHKAYSCLQRKHKIKNGCILARSKPFCLCENSIVCMPDKMPEKRCVFVRTKAALELKGALSAARCAQFTLQERTYRMIQMVFVFNTLPYHSLTILYCLS